MGVIEVPYGCNRTPSEEPGVNGSYNGVLQTPFFNSVYNKTRANTHAIVIKLSFGCFLKSHTTKKSGQMTI